MRASPKQALTALTLLLIGVAVFAFLRSGESIPQVAVAPSVATATEKLVRPEHRTIGTSVEGRAIEAYSYGEGKNKLLFVGGMHGGYEYNSVLLAYEYIDHLREDSAHVPANMTITVIPAANPDGLFAVVGKEGRFTALDATTTKKVGYGRLNAHDVDLNRNFDCNWKPKSMWRGNSVSGGTEAFSEPESQTIRDYVLKEKPSAVVFWHSQSNAVYASECKNGILPDTLAIMDAYAKASGYAPVKSFDAYEITGDAEGWLASIGIPAITVELKTHETVEWKQNLAGITALLGTYETKIAK